MVNLGTKYRGEGESERRQRVRQGYDLNLIIWILRSREGGEREQRGRPVHTAAFSFLSLITFYNYMCVRASSCETQHTETGREPPCARAAGVVQEVPAHGRPVMRGDFFGYQGRMFQR